MTHNDISTRACRNMQDQFLRFLPCAFTIDISFLHCHLLASSTAHEVYLEELGKREKKEERERMWAGLREFQGVK